MNIRVDNGSSRFLLNVAKCLADCPVSNPRRQYSKPSLFAGLKFLKYPTNHETMMQEVKTS
jgi:hypothetical protein